MDEAVVVLQVKTAGNNTMEAEVLEVAVTQRLVPMQLTLAYPDVIHTALDVVPKPGMIAIACLNVAHGRWAVDGNSLTFMPRGSAMSVITGLDDPLLAKILASIFAARTEAFKN